MAIVYCRHISNVSNRICLRCIPNKTALDSHEIWMESNLTPTAMTKIKTEKFPMTIDEHKVCLALGRVRYLPATFDKRLGHNLHDLAASSQLITEKQREWMYRLLYKYRNQLPDLYSFYKNHPHCSRLNQQRKS